MIKACYASRHKCVTSEAQGGHPLGKLTCTCLLSIKSMVAAPAVTQCVFFLAGERERQPGRLPAVAWRACAARPLRRRRPVPVRAAHARRRRAWQPWPAAAARGGEDAVGADRAAETLSRSGGRQGAPEPAQPAGGGGAAAARGVVAAGGGREGRCGRRGCGGGGRRGGRRRARARAAVGVLAGTAAGAAGVCW